MKIEYYKTEIKALDKAHFDEVREWLLMAVLDTEISLEDEAILEDIADKIFYS